MTEPRRKPSAGLAWAARMAWRDSRGQRGVLGLFVLCIVFGIGALVAIRSIQANLEATIERESRALVGSDLELSTRSPFGPGLEAWIAERGGETSREVQFRSMARFPAVDEVRFVQVRALEPGFPFYGALETAPAAVDFRGTRAANGLPLALVEAGLLAQLDQAPGDVIRLGEQDFVVGAALDRVAGESELGGFFAPRVFIPWSELDGTGLMQMGSVAEHKIHFRFDDGLTEEHKAAMEAAKAGVFLDEGVGTTTVEGRQARLERVLNNLFAFLGLVGFIALLLGGLGVGGAVQVYLQPKLALVATLRSLGASARQAFSIYLIQVMAAGLLGAVLGVLLGVGTQLLLPALLTPFLPFAVEVSLDVPSIAFGLVFGWLAATLFALRPLLAVRRVSPLRALRADFEVPGKSDPWVWAVSLAMVALGVSFAVWQSPKAVQGLGFAAGLAAAYGILWGSAFGLRAVLRRFGRRRGSYAVRLALSNLYRPRNRTVFVVTTLGLGAFLISTLAQVQTALLAQIAMDDAGGNRPNLILVDVQADQLEAIGEAMAEAGSPIVETLPVVTMRVQSIKGRPLREWREMPNTPVSGWVFRWEFRATYRDHVLPNAEVVSGEFIGHHAGGEPYPISLSYNLLDDLDVVVGDEIVWDVQGLPMRTVVSSVRQVNWELGRQNFNVLWPTGVLEEAPSMFALAARTESREETLDLQRALGPGFANVSLLDLSLIFETVQTVLGRAAFVIQFMAAFTVLTGLVVLFGALATSRYQRAQESVLLRTLGASGGFVSTLLAWEYALLGFLAATIGVGLSLLASAALAQWVFEAEWVVAWGAVGIVFGTVLGLTLLTGWLNSRGLVKAPPLQILRSER